MIGAFSTNMTMTHIRKMDGNNCNTGANIIKQDCENLNSMRVGVGVELFPVLAALFFISRLLLC